MTEPPRAPSCANVLQTRLAMPEFTTLPMQSAEHLHGKIFGERLSWKQVQYLARSTR